MLPRDGARRAPLRQRDRDERADERPAVELAGAGLTPLTSPAGCFELNVEPKRIFYSDTGN